MTQKKMTNRISALMSVFAATVMLCVGLFASIEPVKAVTTKSESVYNVADLTSALQYDKDEYDSVFIYLLADIYLSADDFIVTDGRNIDLDGNGHQLIQQGYDETIRVESGGRLTISNVTITHEAGKSGTGVFVEEQGFFRMDGGLITGNNASYTYGFGGGVTSRGEVRIIGGEISNNSSGYGGGIFAMNGLVVYGGRL